jgi:hypothetical protein
MHESNREENFLNVGKEMWHTNSMSLESIIQLLKEEK